MADDTTLDDVARMSGVSRATASRALNGRAGVRDDVRERVQLIAKSLGYRPNRAARNLAGGRASVIGLVLGRADLRNAPYEVALLQEVAKVADRHDEGLMLLMDSQEPSEAVKRVLSDSLVEGVIISAVAIGSSWIEELIDAKVPTVLVGSHPRRSDVSVVDVESRESSAALVGHLLDTGCERIATITGPLNRIDAMHRLEGYHLAHKRRSLPVDEMLIANGDFSRLRGYQLTDQLVEQKVDAIFAANDETAIGVFHRAVELGVDIPAELSLAGFDGQTASSVVGPHITSVAQPFERLAAKAVETLLTTITEQRSPEMMLLEPSIFHGSTTRPLSR